jgi:coenzyme F420-reducing hydrogenase delta subunit
MRRVLGQMGIEPGRLKLLWASAAEGAIFAAEVNKFVEQVRELGPLNWNNKNGAAVETPVLQEAAV